MLQLLSDTWDAIVAIYNFIVGSIGGFIDYIVAFIKYLILVINNVFDSIVDFIKDFILFNKTCFQFIIDLFNSIIEASKDIFPIIVDNLKDFIIAAFNLVYDTCGYCYSTLIDSLHTSISTLVSANTFTETAYYCIYQSDIAGALTLISCGMTIWVFRKTIALVTLGYIKI